MTSTFDQSTTLAPPPFPATSILGSLTAGLTIGDAQFDQLPMSQLLAIKRHGQYTVPLPHWVDQDAVRRGQALHLKHFLSFLMSLTGGLLHGFVIGRFAEVLELAGYVKCDWLTFQRFRDTSTFIWSWMAMDVLDPAAQGYRNVIRVRAIHAVARRAVGKRWATLQAQDAQQIGVPLSQYDMALVQMAFGAMTLSTVERECGVTLSAEEKRDYCHLWRYLGHVLGIEDRFNIANSLARAERVFQEFLDVVPLLNRSVRPSCVHLVQGTVRAFGTYTFASKNFYKSLIYGVSRPEVHLDGAWCELEPPPRAYAQRIIDEMNPKHWLLPAWLWHFLFALFVRLEWTFPRFMETFVEAPAQHVPQKLHF